MSVCADPASVRLENTDGSITISQARIASFSDTGVITYEEGILMDELESRNPEAFDKWLDQDAPEDNQLREYMAA